MFQFINKCFALMKNLNTKEDVTEPIKNNEVIHETEKLISIVESYLLDNVTFVESEGLLMDAFSSDLDELTKYIMTVTDVAKFDAKIPNIVYDKPRGVYKWLYNNYHDQRLNPRLDMVTSKTIIMLRAIKDSALPESNFKRFLAVINADLKELVKVLEFFGETK